MRSLSRHGSAAVSSRGLQFHTSGSCTVFDIRENHKYRTSSRTSDRFVIPCHRERGPQGDSFSGNCGIVTSVDLDSFYNWTLQAHGYMCMLVNSVCVRFLPHYVSQPERGEGARGGAGYLALLHGTVKTLIGDFVDRRCYLSLSPSRPRRTYISMSLRRRASLTCRKNS